MAEVNNFYYKKEFEKNIKKTVSNVFKNFGERFMDLLKKKNQFNYNEI